jgi:hypothetical protein
MNTIPHPESIPSRRPVLITAQEWQEDFVSRLLSRPPLGGVAAIQVNALEFAADVALEYVVDGLKNQNPAQAILERLVAKMVEIKKEACK